MWQKAPGSLWVCSCRIAGHGICVYQLARGANQILRCTIDLGSLFVFALQYRVLRGKDSRKKENTRYISPFKPKYMGCESFQD